MDDVSAPWTDDSGEFNLYRPVKHPDVKILEGLRKGDSITLAYSPGREGSKGRYEILETQDGQPKQQFAPSVASRTLPQKEDTQVYTPYSSAVLDSWMAILTQQAGLLLNAFGVASGLLGDVMEKPSEDTLVNVALNLWRRTNQVHRNNMVLAVDADDEEGVYEKVVRDFANSMGIVDAVISSLVELYDTIDDGDGARTLLKDIGLGSKDITNDPETWRYVYNVVESYLEEVAKGETYEQAIANVASKYEIERF
jgi:hypothetical protein